MELLDLGQLVGDALGVAGARRANGMAQRARARAGEMGVEVRERGRQPMTPLAR